MDVQTQSLESLEIVVEHIAADDLATADKVLKRVLSKHEPDHTPEAVKHFVFGAALARRLSPEINHWTNIYLNKYDVPQIELFNLLAQHMPLVSMSAQISNRILADLCQGRDEVTLIDVGIGTGRQMVALLDLLAARADRPKTVNVAGIEPAGWCLDVANRNLQEAAGRGGFDLTFYPIHSEVERLQPGDRQLLREVGPKPIINASFALHHIGDIDRHDVRDPVLRLLRSLDPAAVVLAEPHVDHFEKDLMQRYRNCWTHFGLTFEVIDQLGIEQQQKDALKVCFFGREVCDILGVPDEQRTERHEPASSWLRRLRGAGFVPHATAGAGHGLATPLIDISQRDGYLGLDYSGETIVALFCAVPDQSAPSPVPDLPEAAPRAVRHHRPLDAQAYLAALVAIAKADQVIHELERPFIESQANLFGVPVDVIWEVGSLDEVLAEAGELDEHTREAILRDSVLLAMIDGEYVEAERAQARAIAHKLGFDDAKLKRTEDLSRAFLPDKLDAAPSWFRQLWLISSKQ